MGAIEIEYEGSESFLKEELPALLSAVADLHKSSAPMIENPSPTVETTSSTSVNNRIEGTTATLAAKLGGGTGPDLIMTAAAQLTFVQSKNKFSRKDIVTEIKSATAYYKANYFKNLTPLLNGLVKGGKLMEPSTGHYSLSAPSLKDIGARLACIDVLKNSLHQSGFTKIDKLLLCLGFEANVPKSVSEIKAISKKGGFRQIESWNVSSLLSRCGGLAIRIDKGWELTNKGKEKVAQLVGPNISGAPHFIASTLRSHLSSSSNSDTLAFLEEAIRCYETKLYRSAVVLSWVGAASLLYDFVFTHKLAEFNAEATRRDAKWKTAKNKDDLANLKRT